MECVESMTGDSLALLGAPSISNNRGRSCTVCGSDVRKKVNEEKDERKAGMGIQGKDGNVKTRHKTLRWENVERTWQDKESDKNNALQGEMKRNRGERDK